MLSFNLLLIVLAVFAIADFLVVHFVANPVPGTVLATVLHFFVDVNAKLKAVVDSIFVELTKNWLEGVILFIVYLLVFGLNPVLFVEILVGYLLARLIVDAFAKNA